jgi:L-amino acid N-acyltransferase YncA
VQAGRTRRSARLISSSVSFEDLPMPSNTDIEIRSASAADAARIVAIYNDYVTGTTISFEEQPVLEADMAGRIRDVVEAGLPWLVAFHEGELVGYAYATKWRARTAYRHSVESTVYLDRHAFGRGWGTLLYRSLLERLRLDGLHTVIAGITQPNERSVVLHERLGFRKVAHFSEVGFKFGEWVDVGYWQFNLKENA